MLYLIILISALNLVKSQTCNYPLSHFQQNTYTNFMCTFNPAFDDTPVWAYDEVFCNNLIGSEIFSTDPTTNVLIFQQNALAFEANYLFLLDDLTIPEDFSEFLEEFIDENTSIMKNDDCSDVDSCDTIVCKVICENLLMSTVDCKRYEMVSSLNSPEIYAGFASTQECTDICCEQCTLKEDSQTTTINSGQTKTSSSIPITTIPDGQITDDVNTLIGISVAALIFAICACFIICSAGIWYCSQTGYFTETEAY